jgi:hypothetical protein
MDPSIRETAIAEAQAGKHLSEAEVDRIVAARGAEEMARRTAGLVNVLHAGESIGSHPVPALNHLG